MPRPFSGGSGGRGGSGGVSGCGGMCVRVCVCVCVGGLVIASVAVCI